MAAVFLARDLRHDRPVALKVLHPELAMSIGTDRFAREIRFAARLQHPHILPVHDSGDVPGSGGQGRKAEAMREGERAVAIRGNDGFQGPTLRHQLSRIYQLVGEPVKAMEQLEGLLRVPYMISPGWLRAEPSLEPLRSHPRFQRLLAVADSLAR